MAYLFGPAGWSYKDWEGTVYPAPKPANFNHLQFLGRSFDFMEVNTSFYHIPSIKLTSGWVKKTESLPDFKFWIKVYQDFTHKRLLEKGAIEAFQQALQPLVDAGKLAGVLAQFPYSFKPNPENLDYLLDLCRAFHDYHPAVEFRHHHWNRQEVLDTFQENQLTWVNIDQPPISLNLPLTAWQTHPEIAYFRLHGRNTQSWFSDEGRDARYNYDYSAKELNQIAEFIKKLKETAKKIFISGNNHYKGNAVQNLLALKKILSPSGS